MSVVELPLFAELPPLHIGRILEGTCVPGLYGEAEAVMGTFVGQYCVLDDLNGFRTRATEVLSNGARVPENKYRHPTTHFRDPDRGGVYSIGEMMCSISCMAVVV